MHILEEGKDICQAAGELILQPQSELCSVREYLAENGYVTEAERMVFEDGKYYPMMRVHYQAEKNEDADKAIKDMENSKEQKKADIRSNVYTADICLWKKSGTASISGERTPGV